MLMLFLPQTVSETACEMVLEQQCSTVTEEECSSEEETVCATINEQQCRAQPEQVRGVLIEMISREQEACFFWPFFYLTNCLISDLTVPV